MKTFTVAVPKLYLADPSANACEMVQCIRSAIDRKTDYLFFPELSITGCSCGDLFQMEFLASRALDVLVKLAEKFRDSGLTFFIGLPLFIDHAVYSVYAEVCRGKILAFYCKTNATSPFAAALPPVSSFHIPGQENIPVLSDFSQYHPWCLNIDSVPAEGGSIERQRRKARHSVGVYISVQPGIYESTTDGVYSGFSLLAFNGNILAETVPFRENSQLCSAQMEENIPSDAIDIPEDRKCSDPAPFLPKSAEECNSVCSEILAIQKTALFRRMETCHAKKLVLGISGGLDSTLALLAAAGTLKEHGKSSDSLIAVTMPGFGTTARTKSNAELMAAALNCDLRRVDIRPACLQHFHDIGHDPADHSVTYENTQARERTQILMDIANREGGILVGTGDLSEIALGWCTYNADHISMYNPNCGIPKTLMRVMVRWYADSCDSPELANILRDVLNTPVSPELLPADENGSINQKTENILGPYELHDFYIWHLVFLKEAPRDILNAAFAAFSGTYPQEEIIRTLKLFLKRFFTQQFKRSCSPDGPRTTPVSLSPRNAWRVPSDALDSSWTGDL